MATDAFLDSNYWLAMHSLARTPVTRGSEQSSHSGNLLPKDEQYRTAAVPLLNASPGSLASSVTARLADLNAGIFLGEMNPTVLSNTKNLRSSVMAGSLVPDANSAVSKGPQLYRSANTDFDSHLNLSAPPVLLSHSVSVERSSNVGDSSIAQQTSQSSQDSSQVLKRKQNQGVPTATHQHALQKCPNSPHIGVIQELCASAQVHKKPRLDIKQDGYLHQRIIQQLLESQDPAQLKNHMPELQALIQRHKLQNQKQQKILQASQHLPEVDIKQQQKQMRHQLVEQPVRQGPALYPLDGGVCSRRLMQYLYHLRHRPSDNSIAYWRKFVAEYYAPCAKKRWCLSLCDNVGHHALGVFPQAAMEIWQCDTCGSKSGRGFEATFEVLPRIYKITFESGVIDELLFLDLPREHRSLSGLMMLEYGKAVQESVYEQLRVVHEGKLRIVFNHDLKILSWEFCAWNHDELLPRSLAATQVNRLVHNAQKYQSTVDDSGSDGVSTHDLQANCNRFLAAGRQLERNLDLKLVDDLGFSRRLIRCLQITEIVNSMKNLMSFSRDYNIGPIESLNKYSQLITKTKLPKDELQEKELPESSQVPPTDRNKLLALSPCLSNNENESSNMAKSGLLNGSEEAALVLTGYYQKLPRQNSLNPHVSKTKREPSCTNNRSRQQQDALFKSLPVNGSLSFCSEDSRNIQDHMIQKLLQQMINNSRAVNKSLALSPCLSNNENESSNMAKSGLLNGSEEAALVLTGYYQKLPRLNSLNPNVSKTKWEPSCTNNRSRQQQDALIESLPVNGSSSFCSEDSRNIQDHMIQKLLQQMINNSRAVTRGQVEKESCKVSSSMVAGLPTRAMGTENVKAGIDFENSKASAAAPGNAVASTLGRWGASNRDSSGFCSHDSFVKREPDLLEKLNLPEEVRNMVQVYYEKGISDGGHDHRSCGWRA